MLLLLFAFLSGCNRSEQIENSDYSCNSSSSVSRNDSNFLFPVNGPEFSGFIDRQGNVMIQGDFKNVSEFSEGLSAFQSSKNNLWGYIDSEGNIVIPPSFEQAFLFKDGRAIVSIGDREGVIDESGNYVVPLGIHEITRFSHNRAFIRDSTAWRMIDLEGNYVTQDSFLQINGFRDGLASFSGLNNDRSLSGYVNTEGVPEIISGVRFHINIEDLGFSFDRDEVFLIKPVGLMQFFSFEEWGDRTYGLIDDEGQIAVPLRYDFVSVESGCIARVIEEDKYGIVDLFGNVVASADFNYIGEYSEGLAIAQLSIDNAYGYINERGKFVISPSPMLGFSSELLDKRYFANDRALFQEEGKFGYINSTGEVAISPQFEKAFPFDNGLARFENPNEWGYVDTNGVVVWKASTDSEISP